jgi:hypothetical protein
VGCEGLHVHMAVHCGLKCALQLADGLQARASCCGSCANGQSHAVTTITEAKAACKNGAERFAISCATLNPHHINCGCSGLLVLGALTLINTFFGCIGSCYKRSLLSMYLIFGTILTVAQARRPLQTRSLQAPACHGDAVFSECATTCTHAMILLPSQS